MWTNNMKHQTLQYITQDWGGAVVGGRTAPASSHPPLQVIMMGRRDADLCTFAPWTIPRNADAGADSAPAPGHTGTGADTFGAD